VPPDGTQQKIGLKCSVGGRDHLACCGLGMTNGAEFVCERHLQMAPASSLNRVRQTGARLQLIRARWNDDDYYERAVASGRYLKLCELLRWAEDSDEEAWTRMKREILKQQRRDAAKLSSEQSGSSAHPRLRA